VSRPGNARGVVFVDLDGTLTLGNSFHEFLRCLWSMGRLRTRARVGRAAAARLGRHAPPARAALKWHALRAFEAESPDRRRAIVEATIEQVLKTISRPVLSSVKRLQADGYAAVLATAAPDCYARPLATQLGFDECLATAPAQDVKAWFELIGPAKEAACRSWLQERGYGPHTDVRVFTDHDDDLPLLRLARHVTIQAAAHRLSAFEQALGSEVFIEHIDPAGPQQGGGIWLWFDDRPAGPYDAWEVRTILSKHRFALMYTGDRRWTRVRPGDSLSAAARRGECPVAPSMGTRLWISTTRRLVRDRLRVFH